MTSVPWDDFRILLAVARAGSIRAAALTLDTSHATVSRRLAGLRERLGVRLFEREGRRLRPTVAGAELVEAASRIADEMDDATRRVVGQDFELRGTVRVSVTDAIAQVIAPDLAAFASAHPDIRIELATGLSLANLTRREADVVVRITDHPQETLVGRRVCALDVAAYATIEMLEAGIDWTALPWVAWDERYGTTAPRAWLREAVPDRQIRATGDSETTMLALVAAGVGAGFVPCFLGNAEPRLRPLDPPPCVVTTSLWVLTHADLRSTARVRAVSDALREGLAQRAATFLCPVEG